LASLLGWKKSEFKLGMAQYGAPAAGMPSQLIRINITIFMHDSMYFNGYSVRFAVRISGGIVD
jgi:hypothetical protein